jgi:hypothetical protein
MVQGFEASLLHFEFKQKGIANIGNTFLRLLIMIRIE